MLNCKWCWCLSINLNFSTLQQCRQLWTVLLWFCLVCFYLWNTYFSVFLVTLSHSQRKIKISSIHFVNLVLNIDPLSIWCSCYLCWMIGRPCACCSRSALSFAYSLLRYVYIGSMCTLWALLYNFCQLCALWQYQPCCTTSVICVHCDSLSLAVHCECDCLSLAVQLLSLVCTLTVSALLYKLCHLCALWQSQPCCTTSVTCVHCDNFSPDVHLLSAWFA